MNKLVALIFSGIVTLGLGAGAIYGNSLIVSQAMAESIPSELVVTFAPDLPEERQEATLVKTFEAPATIFKTLGNGTSVMVQYSYDEQDVLQAIMTYTFRNGDSEITQYQGDDAEAVIKRMELVTRDNNEEIPYVVGKPGAEHIVEQTAIDIAIQALIAKYALKQETIDRFTVTPVFYEIYEDIEKPIWWIYLDPTIKDDFTEIGCYTAIIDAATGEVEQLLTAADGKG